MIHLAALWVLVHVVGRAPARVLFALAALGGTAAWHLSPRLQRVTRDHMRHVLGVDADPRDVDAAARACVRSAAYYYVDFARYPHLSPEAVLAQVESSEGMDVLIEAARRGEGVVLVAAHVGAPEMIGQAFVPVGLDMALIVEPLQPPALHRFVDGLRARHGMTFLGADLAGLRAARAHLARGGVLGALVDRDVLGTGAPYVFFGEAAAMPTGAIDLARRTGATVVAARVLRGSHPGRYRITVEALPLPPATGDAAADLDAAMRTEIAWLERTIASAPGQWFALQPVWAGLAGDRPRGRRRSPARRDVEG